MADFGGLIRMTVSGQSLKMRGTLKMRTAGASYDPIDNMDGSVSRTIKNAGPEADISLEATAGVDIDSLIKGGPYNVNYTEEDTGALHVFTAANFYGQKEEDRETGEISGLKIKCGRGNYQRTTS